MEVNYNGALVLPSSYVMMDEEEMTYVEGGVKVETWILSAAIDVVVTAICGGAAASAIGWLMGKGWSALAARLIKGSSQLASASRTLLSNGLSSYITGKLGIVGFALGFTSVGGFVMNCWDMFDNGKINGYVNIG